MQKSSLATLYKSDLLWMPQSPTNEKSTVVSGNDFVLSGNRLLRNPMLT